MNDGIIKGDGTSRKMKATLPATYDGFRQAVEAGEQTLDVMFNAAGWDQQPTFLNKQNLGQDKTMAVYNRGPEGTVDDLFQSVFAVGDIKISARTNLGDHWILCNGEPFDTSEYPELKSVVIPRAGSLEEKTEERIDGYTNRVSPLGDYIIRIKTDLSGYSYTKLSEQISVEKQADFSGLNVNDVSYVTFVKRNDKFIVYRKEMPIGNSLCFCFSDSIDGPWKTSSKVNINDRTSNDIVTEIGYSNGYFYFVLQHRTTGTPSGGARRIVYTDNPEGEWTVIDSPFDQSAYINGLVYSTSRGKWLIFSDAGEVKMSSGKYPGDFSETLQTPLPLYSACDGDGTIYAGSKTYRGILKLEPGSQAFEKIDYPSDETGQVFYPYCVLNAGDFIIAGGTGGTTAYEKGAGRFLEKISFSISEPPTFFEDYISYPNGSNSLKLHWQKADVLFGYKTPEISISNAYAYIRGK